MLRMDTPPDPKELLARAVVYLRRGEPGRAIEILTTAIEAAPADADLHFLRANAGTGSGDAALVDYSTALRLDPQLADAFFHRGRAFADKGEHAAAVADLTRAIALEPDNAAAYNLRGIVRADAGDRDAAVADF